MTIWYGFRSTMYRSGVNYKGVLTRPNGSNVYLIENDDISKLPQSHVPINIKLKYEDIIDIPVLSEILKNKINDYLTAPGSLSKIVEDVRTELSEDICIFTPVYNDNTPITVPIEILNEIIEEIDYEPVEDELNSSCILYNEAPVITLPIPIKVDLIMTEYYAKCCYIYATIYNQWLLPYANRIGWRNIQDDVETSTVILPYWDDDDILLYNELLLDSINLQQSSNSWSFGYIQLSNGIWYSLPDKIKSELDIDYNLSYTFPSENIYNNWKISNLKRVETQIREGLLPFHQKYPEIRYNDGDKRINIVKVDSFYSVGILPDNYLLGIYDIKTDYEKIKSVYTELWNSGAVLTNYGHYSYINSYDNIDESNVNYELRNSVSNILKS